MPSERDDLPVPYCEMTRIIYETMYANDISEGEMPIYKEAKQEGIGGYERAALAARLVAFRIRSPTQQ